MPGQRRRELGRSAGCGPLPFWPWGGPKKCIPGCGAGFEGKTKWAPKHGARRCCVCVCVFFFARLYAFTDRASCFGVMFEDSPFGHGKKAQRGDFWVWPHFLFGAGTAPFLLGAKGNQEGRISAPFLVSSFFYFFFLEGGGGLIP